MMYQATKQLTKFVLAGITAVICDLLVYYLFSAFIPTDIAKAIGFLSGTVVTYNLNKYWTWRQNNKNNRRLVNFMLLYGFSLIVNVAINGYLLHQLPDFEFLLQIRKTDAQINPLLAFKGDKITAFFVATACSTVVNFLGQKYWVFKEAEESSDVQTPQDTSL